MHKLLLSLLLLVGFTIPEYSFAQAEQAERLFRNKFSTSISTEFLSPKGEKSNIEIRVDIQSYESDELKNLRVGLKKALEDIFKENPNAKVSLKTNLDSGLEKDRYGFSEAKISGKRASFADWAAWVDSKVGHLTSVEDIGVGVQRILINGVMVGASLFIAGHSAEYALVAAGGLAVVSGMFSIFSNAYAEQMFKQRAPNSPILGAKFLHLIPIETAIYFAALEAMFAQIPNAVAAYFGLVMDISMGAYVWECLRVAALVAVAQGIMEHTYNQLKKFRYKQAEKNYKDYETFNKEMKMARVSFNRVTLLGSAMSVVAMVAGTIGSAYQIATLTTISDSVLIFMFGLGMHMAFKVTRLDRAAENADLSSQTSQVEVRRGEKGTEVYIQGKKIDGLSLDSSDLEKKSSLVMRHLDRLNKGYKDRVAGLSHRTRLSAELTEIWANLLKSERMVPVSCKDVL